MESVRKKNKKTPTLKLVYSFHVNIDSRFDVVIEEISNHMGKFYNMTLYEYHQKNYLTQNQFYNKFKEHLRCGYLQSHTYIYAIKQCMKDMSSFYALLELYKEDPKKNQDPSLPRYKHENRKMTPTFLKNAIRKKDDFLLLSIGKKMKKDKDLKCIDINLQKQVSKFLSDKNIKVVTLKRLSNGKYEVRVIYEIDKPKLINASEVMAIDLGVSNLAAITFKESQNQILIDGNIIKSRIAIYNNQIAEQQSKHMIIIGSDDFKATNRMKKTLATRRGFVDYYIHKASKMIIDIAVEHRVGKVVIGDFKGIEQRNKIKYFVQIPHHRLINQIKYKAAKNGIQVIMMNEAYTSSVSSVDLEKIEKESSDKSRRIMRGAFVTTKGMINSDINGSLNILRKYLGENNIPRLIQSMRDKGFRENPIRLRVV